MKQSFFSKIIETFLAFVMSIGGGNATAPQSTTTPEEEARTTYEVYREIVQNTADEYGYAKKSNEAYAAVPKGLLEAKAFDITGDNEDELFLVYANDDNVNMKVYEYNNGTAEEMWHEEAERTDIFQLSVSDMYNNCTFWSYAISFPWTAGVYACIDGEYRSGKSGSFTEDEQAYIDTNDGSISAHASAEREIMIKRLGMDESGSSPAILMDIDIGRGEYNVNIDDLKSRWDLSEPLRSASEILGDIAYYGDRSKCKMTKEMAQAYADALSIDIDDATSNDKGIYAMLMDLANDGMPILSVIPFMKSPDGTPFYVEFTPLCMHIWGWNGTELQKKDFDEDFGGEGAGYYYFTPNKKNAMITVGPRESGRDDGPQSDWDLLEYTISNGQIKLQNKVVEPSPEQYLSLQSADGYDVYYSYLRSFELEGNWRDADDLIAGLEEYINSFNKPIRHETSVAETASNEKSNISIDYSNTDNGAKILKKLIKDTKPNNSAISDIAEYIRVCVRDASEQTVTAEDNTVTIKNKVIKKSAKRANKELEKFNKVLSDNSVTLHKSIDEILLIRCKGTDINNTVRVVFDNEIVSAMNNADEVIIVIDDKHQIKFSTDTLKAITNKYPAVIICITKSGDDIYEIEFIDNDSKAITQLDGNIGFVIPAKNNMYTVQTQNNNIGCQFDASNNTVMFESAYSGSYTVFENNADISDISDLDKAHQDAIQFMVSKGYFGLDNDNFNPTNATIRYEFAQALTGVFFMHDPNRTETGFTDVPSDSPYLSYVASGEYWDIIDGYDEITFGGNDNISYEQAIAMCSRLLKDKKGYNNVENPDDYLNFTDNSEISAWAKETIALAVREGLIADGGKL